MTNIQLYLAIGVPILFNFGIVLGFFLLLNGNIGTRFEGLGIRFEGINQRFEGINQRFDAIDKRFDDMRDLWRAELHRVEEVLDARLKHLEER